VATQQKGGPRPLDKYEDGKLRFYHSIYGSVDLSDKQIRRLQKMFGNHYAGDALANLRIGYQKFQAAYHFTCLNDCRVDRFIYFNTWSTTKPGYHAGTGGKLLIELTKLDGTVLTQVRVPSPLQQDKQLKLIFDKAVKLQKAESYLLTFTNYDEDPEHNHVSVDTMLCLLPPKTVAPNPQELVVLYRQGKNQPWEMFKPDLDAIPIFSMFDGDKVAVPGYSGMESWVTNARPIDKSNSVRQVFTLDKDTSVSIIYVRMCQLAPGDLVLYLKQGTGTIRTSTPTGIIPQPVTRDKLRIGHEWVRFALPSQLKLPSRAELNIQLSCTTGSYEVYPIRDGASFGYAPLWPNAHAEYLSDGTWKGWDMWGKSNLQCAQLQLFCV